MIVTIICCVVIVGILTFFIWGSLLVPSSRDHLQQKYNQDILNEIDSKQEKHNGDKTEAK